MKCLNDSDALKFYENEGLSITICKFNADEYLDIIDVITIANLRIGIFLGNFKIFTSSGEKLVSNFEIISGIGTTKIESLSSGIFFSIKKLSGDLSFYHEVNLNSGERRIVQNGEVAILVSGDGLVDSTKITSPAIIYSNKIINPTTNMKLLMIS